MATLKSKAEEILNEKTTKIKPENIKKNVTIFNITGTLEEGAPTLDINMPNILNIYPAQEYQNIILVDTPFIEGVNILVNLYSRLKESSDAWEYCEYCSTNNFIGTYDYNDSLAFDLNLWFYGEADNYEYKFEFSFIKENYIVEKHEALMNIIAPEGATLNVSIMGPNYTNVQDIFNVSDIIITDDNDNIIDDLNIVKEESYWTDTFTIKELPIGNYKLKLKHNDNIIQTQEFDINAEDMTLSSGYTKRLDITVSDIVSCNIHMSYRNPLRDNDIEDLYFGKIKLVRKDENLETIDEETQSSPYASKTYMFDNGKYVWAYLSRPGFRTQDPRYTNEELARGSYGAILEQNFDTTTHNSISIVIGPWEDKQAGSTIAAPDDLDIDIYLQDDNEDYIKVEDDSIGYYIVNHKINQSAVVIFGKLNQNVKLVLNDARYRFDGYTGNEAVFWINDWGYTVGLIPNE